MLTPKVQLSSGQMSGEMLADALYGLRSLRDSPEARGLVAALIPKVRSSSATLAGGWGVGDTHPNFAPHVFEDTFSLYPQYIDSQKCVLRYAVSKNIQECFT